MLYTWNWYMYQLYLSRTNKMGFREFYLQVLGIFGTIEGKDASFFEALDLSSPQNIYRDCIKSSPSKKKVKMEINKLVNNWYKLWKHSEYTAAAAAAKSLQSCPTLCDPMDCSPPGPSVHGIFQARVLEWGAIAYSVRIHYGCAILSLHFPLTSFVIWVRHCFRGVLFYSFFTLAV